ncbi:hypothetical protein OAD24_15435, partial [Pseudomonadales bacterium]|nr:hypothetical protein [Pseudomonadales bacterium]
GYMSGFKQSALHGAANTANTTVNGSVAVATAGTDELLSSMKLDASDFTDGAGSAGSAGDAIAIAPRTGGATDATPAAGDTHPLTLIARMARLLDQQNVDSQGRWLILDPVFMEVLKDEDSRLFNADFGGGGLQNGQVSTQIHGFQVYQSNNLPSVGTGPSFAGTNSSSNYGVIVAGHSSAVATAEQINKTETYRDPDSFADIVRGMHLYGRKILRPEALVNAIYHLA